jgi:hypothetical protein
MTTTTIKLQYQLSNGSWVYCDDRSEEFLARCMGQHNMDRNQTIEALLSGSELRNGSNEWYSVCRSEIPILDEKMKRRQAAEQALAEQVKTHTETKCNIYLDVPFSQKDVAKLHGAKWDKQYKMWYYPSAEGEYLPACLVKFGRGRTTGEENQNRFAETCVDWYDR